MTYTYQPSHLGTLEESPDVGDIIISTRAGEMLRLCGNGDIYVKTKLVENDKDVVQGMRDLLTECKLDEARRG